MIVGRLVMLFGLFLAAQSAAAQWENSLPPQTTKAVGEIIADEMQKQQIVGIAVGLLRDGHVCYLNGFGWADREGKIPVDSGTLFRWASISKTLTAVAALNLHEDQKLDLDADVRTLVPEFPDKGETITTRKLLCHQAGIVHYSNGKVIRTNREYDQPNPFQSVILALDTFKESPLVAKPGERFSYTTHGYMLLSAVVERAGNQPFAERIHQSITDKIGLKTLKPDYQWEKIPNRAVGYRPDPRRAGTVVPSTDTDVSWKLGGGGFLSNIDDLAFYTQALMGDALLSAELKRLSWKQQRTDSGKDTVFGLGFGVTGSGDAFQVGHSGAQEKSRTKMAFYPHRRTGVVVMCNTEGTNVNRISQRLFKTLENLPSATSE